MDKIKLLRACLFIGLALLMLACSQDDSSMKPSEAKKDENTPDTPAVFIQEKISLGPSDVHYSRTDTVLTGNDIFISTPKNYENYKWRIGREQSFRRGRKIEILFRNPVRVKVRLYGTQKNGKTDSLSRFLTVLNHPVVSLNNTTPLIDTFKGYNKSNPTHKFRVYFAETHPIGFHEPELFFFNLPEGCSEREKVGIWASEFSIGFKAMVFSSSSTGCKGVYGVAYLQDNRKRLRAEYELYKYPGTRDTTRVNKTFIGTKLD